MIVVPCQPGKSSRLMDTSCVKFIGYMDTGPVRGKVSP
jgi:hypothetical protein